MPRSEPEPKPLSGELALEPWDFEALGPVHSKNPEANEYRLRTRRKLLAWAKQWVAGLPEGGLDVRTSIHNPHAFNGMRVQRLWAYMTRTKAQKTHLRKVLGRDLAKDLDSAYRNAYLCLAIEHQALEVSLRIHPDAWYDGQNLLNRVQREGARELLGLLNQLDGFTLRLHDWKGRWPLGSLSIEALEEVLRFYKPGELGFVVERSWPIPNDLAAREVVLATGPQTVLQAEWARLLPLYRYAAWSEQSDYLFSS
ncbi:MAG: hypothetical protein H6830_05935 [Planctomycetes bacterium]|nr:hypothetical protein [Planctomycetota bacterium]MCB9909063.1 hypothetical protein [Planctomycetota bacterium]MCB9911690.1 hypothetical protein [Planctomycetota bacterium]HPF13211.1 hypothetical protein [Planctomycetota bacterium]